MIMIFAKKITIYSFPLGEELISGYEGLVHRVCNVHGTGGDWTGFLVKDTVLTSGLPNHDREFDLRFYKQPQTAGFLRRDFGDILELSVGNRPNVDSLGGVQKHPLPRQSLFVIGNFFGIPFEMVKCEVEMVGKVTDLSVFDEEQMDMHTCGAPVFDKHGRIVGIVEAYVPGTDKLLIRALMASPQGELK